MRIISLLLLVSALFWTVIATQSCTHYIDKTKSEKRTAVYQGYFDFSPDSNSLLFKSNIGLSSDGERYRPKPFYTKLPKGLIQYQLSNAQTFSFYYKRGQGIFIFIDLKNGTAEPKQDSAYMPTLQDIAKFRTHFTADSKDRYNLWNIEYRHDRRQFMLKRGSATILLYNILPKNYDKFLTFIKGFEFI